MDEELKMHFMFQNFNLNLRQMVRSEVREFANSWGTTSFKVSPFLFKSLCKGKSKPIKLLAKILSVVIRRIKNEIIIGFIF
jgi:hypothetical protein